MKSRIAWITAAACLLALAAAWVLVPQAPQSATTTAEHAAPATLGRNAAQIPIVEHAWAPTTFEEGIPAVSVNLSQVPTVPRGNVAERLRLRDRRPETPVPPEVMERMRQESMNLPFSSNIQIIDEGGVSAAAAAVSFLADGIDASESCQGCATVPPDPEMAAGPNHLIVVTNVAFAIYDKATGARLAGPIDFDQFFAATGCSGSFDPNALYDESADRFIVGVDGNGTHYCVGATATGNPTGTWYTYRFQTIARRNQFFDYPHAGVGRDAVYMGANIFRGPFFQEGRAWAMDKTAMYAGAPMAVVSQSAGGDSTPQPTNLHGWNQGTWPTTGPHYILTDDQYNGATYGVFTWSNPFGGGGGTFTKTGVFNLNAATGVTAGQPISSPQLGGSNVQGNDWRVQDAEWRNGKIWTTNTIACNPGGGTVNCLRWAQIDPATLAVLDAGVYASSGVHRIFGDVAANHCDDMGIGYTRTSSSNYLSVWATGRQSGDPAGTLQAEVICLNGQGTYVSFDSTPYRWGDYSGMTVDPNGVDFWYLGEYSKPNQSNPAFTSTDWGTVICKVSFPCSAP